MTAVDPSVPAHEVIIVGAGIGGLAAAMALRAGGVTDLVILERSDGVGGTWRHNTYPGAACDVPSHLYCFSSLPNPEWSTTYAGQPEILDYLHRCARDARILDHLRTGVVVTGATWIDDQQLWSVSTSDGNRLTGRVVIFAVGMLDQPRRPDILGLDTFRGPVLHSARWDHEVSLVGRKVGLVGTGASGVQVLPEVAPVAAHTTVFQRTPAYVIPRVNTPYSAEQRAGFASEPESARAVRDAIFRHYEDNTAFRSDDPRLAGLQAFALKHLAAQISDPTLRQQLTPAYPAGCKRVLVSSDFYPALARDDVTLVTGRIDEVTPDGVVAGGVHHDLDVLILATGFTAHDYVRGIEVQGRAGLDLHRLWTDGAHAYLGMAVSGFPNMFLMYGPNTNQGGNSITIVLEAQADYIAQAVARGGTLEVRPDVMATYDAGLQAELVGTVWTACSSYYAHPSGRVVTQLPHPSAWYTDRTATLDPADYL